MLLVGHFHLLQRGRDRDCICSAVDLPRIGGEEREGREGRGLEDDGLSRST